MKDRDGCLLRLLGTEVLRSHHVKIEGGRCRDQVAQIVDQRRGRRDEQQPGARHRADPAVSNVIHRECVRDLELRDDPSGTGKIVNQKAARLARWDRKTTPVDHLIFEPDGEKAVSFAVREVLDPHVGACAAVVLKPSLENLQSLDRQIVVGLADLKHPGGIAQRRRQLAARNVGEDIDRSRHVAALAGALRKRQGHRKIAAGIGWRAVRQGVLHGGVVASEADHDLGGVRRGDQHHFVVGPQAPQLLQRLVARLFEARPGALARLHASGRVEDEDVPTVDLSAGTVGPVRPRQSDDEAGEQQELQEKEEIGPEAPRADGVLTHRFPQQQRRHRHTPAPALPQIEEHQYAVEAREQQREGFEELNHRFIGSSTH